MVWTSILYGVEGKDYTIKDDGQLEMINKDTLIQKHGLPDNINFKRYQELTYRGSD